MEKYIEVDDLTGLDATFAKKLLAGQYKIDLVIDLHSYTQNAAHELLMQTVNMAIMSKKRCILVITGKGRQGQGVLLGQVPKWLNTLPFSKNILAITRANIKHGGDGAYYVVLKRIPKI